VPQKFPVGSKVYSSQLGAGEVLLIEGYGDKERLTIRFDASGVRQVLSKFFLLEPYDNDLHATGAVQPSAATETFSPPLSPIDEPVAPAGSSRESPPSSPASAESSDVAPPVARAHPAPAPQPSAAVHPPIDARPRIDSRTHDQDLVGRAVPASSTATTGSIKEALREVLREEMGVPELRMLDRWKGGTMTIRPGRAGQKEKEIPIDAFFHKIVMVRDRLRVLEQRINAHTGLSDADKVELQQYVTRIYGTLTTFNVLFADRNDWFVGQTGSED
jgi:hypothetical protein